LDGVQRDAEPIDRLSPGRSPRRSAAGAPGPGLHVVATPIGHLADISLRALHVLAAADVVLCEDTRVTRRLIERYRLSPRLVSYHEHNAAARRPQVMAWLAEGASVALVSDAGTPLVSDPGYRLVAEALAAGHRSTRSGTSAVLAGLVVSGLPTDRFWFEGFLPAIGRPRGARLARLDRLDGTLVFFESPRRCRRRACGPCRYPSARGTPCRPGTDQTHETVLRGKLPELAQRLAETGAPRARS
jgi:16S rRNA (cytidine1402-2'-O)-methyltransferase